jgi:hypothetical protein
MFLFYKKREKFSDYLKPRKKIIIDCKRKLIGKGFKTDIICNHKLTEETKKAINLLSEAAKQRNSRVPFALSGEIKKRFEDYEIYIAGIETTFPNLFQKGCEEAGVRINEGRYQLLDDIRKQEPETSSSPSSLENSVLKSSLYETMFRKKPIVQPYSPSIIEVSEIKKPEPVYIPPITNYDNIFKNLKKAGNSEED